MNLTNRMTDTVTLAAPTGRSAHGDPTYAAARTIAARVERDVIRTDAKGEDRVATMLYTHSAIAVGERCWLPGADTGNADAATEVVHVKAGDSFVDGRTLYEAEV